MAAMTGGGYSRKKQPEAVRRAILDEAIRLAGSHGVGAVTIQAVAEAAGVTKGGVFHHFPSKQALVAGLLTDVIGRLDVAIDRYLEGDAGPGRFTRAYVETLVVHSEFGIGSPFDALALTTITDPAMGVAWERWIAGRLEQHRATDDDPRLQIVRYAADGAWLAHLGGKPGEHLEALRDRLIEMTRREGAA